MELHIRFICPHDIPDIDKLGTCTYPGNYDESTESFQSKIVHNPHTCWVATVDGYVAGYVIAFPYVLGDSYPINQIYSPIENPNCLYIHDLCVSPVFRGLGLAKSLIERVLSLDNKTIALVAGMQSHSFWHKLGFKPEHEVDYYGMPATYMVLRR